MVDVPDISNVMMCLTSIDSQLVQICITWCTSLDCVKYYAAQYNASNGRWQKFVTLEVSPSSETNYVVAQWTEQPPLSKIIGNNIRFHDKTFISSFSFTNSTKFKKNWFCCIPDNQKFTLIFAFLSVITPTMSKNISN